MSDFRWLIEAPGPRYLAVQRLRMSDSFEWTTDHDKALAFRSQDQADALRVEIEAVGADPAKFLAFFKIKALEAMPAGRWNEAVAMLEAKRMKEAA